MLQSIPIFTCANALQCNPIEGDPILRGPVPRLDPAPDNLHLGAPGVSRQHGLAYTTGFQSLPLLVVNV